MEKRLLFKIHYGSKIPGGSRVIFGRQSNSSIYETGPGTNILKVHLISMRTLYVRYSRKTRNLSKFLVVKNFLKI